MVFSVDDDDAEQCFLLCTHTLHTYYTLHTHYTLHTLHTLHIAHTLDSAHPCMQCGQVSNFKILAGYGLRH